MNGAALSTGFFRSAHLRKVVQVEILPTTNSGVNAPFKRKGQLFQFSSIVFKGSKLDVLGWGSVAYPTAITIKTKQTPHAGAALGALCRCASAQMTTGGFTHYPGRGTSEPNGFRKMGSFCPPTPRNTVCCKFQCDKDFWWEKITN